MIALPGSGESINTTTFALNLEASNTNLPDYSFLAPETLLITEDETDIFQHSLDIGSLLISYALIERAEGGTVISFYDKYDDPTPAVTISSSIDIHEPVRVPLDQNGHKNNVNVFVHNPTQSFERISISKPYPHFLVL